jgi:hypothetical protein
MLKWLALLIGAAYAQGVALPPSHLIHKDQATCLQRSKQQCQALGCDGVSTIYWWNCTTGPLQAGIVGPSAVPAGSYSMKVEKNGPYAATYSTPTSGGAVGLTTEEQKNLVTSTAIAPILPPPPPPP